MKKRIQVKQEAEIQKREMIEKFEKMKLKGRFNRDELIKMGINYDEI